MKKTMHIIRYMKARNRPERTERFGMTTGRSVLAGILSASILLLLASCFNFNNPVDPGGTAYNGYLTVTDPDDIALCSPGDYVFGYPIFVWSEVLGVSRYHIQIASTTTLEDGKEIPDPAYMKYEDSACPANYIDLTGVVSANSGQAYWRVSAYDSDAGEWGAWSDTGYTYIGSANAELVAVAGGSFTMGSDADSTSDTFPAHVVNLDSFFIGKYEVSEYDFLSSSGSYIELNDGTYYYGSDYLPAYDVPWKDAITYCNYLSEQENLDPVYTFGLGGVTADFSKNGFRLPTEAEWEYAARGGAKSQGYTYAGSNNADDCAWYEWNASGTQELGSKIPNELGIYDMSGNVWEWCWDWYGADSYYSLDTMENPAGPESGSYRVIRGGCILSWTSDLETTRRYYMTPTEYHDTDVGFRVVRKSSTPGTTMNGTWDGVSPEDTGTTADTTPLLQWTAIENCDLYQVHIFVTTAAGTETAFDGTDTRDTTEAQYQIPDADAFTSGDKVYWRVRAFEEATGYLSPWSDAFSFTVE